MSNIATLKADGSLNISVQSKFFETIRTTHAWFTHKGFTLPTLIALACVDIGGFWQIAEATMADDALVRFIIVLAFVAPFEIAPLFIGYSISLKCYDLGGKIWNIVLWLSTAAFALGWIGNIIYRVKTMNVAYFYQSEEFNIALPLTLLMIILPLVTSLINIVIGCLSFDPLLFDLKRISKRLSVLKAKENQIKAYISEMDDEDNQKNGITSDIQVFYKQAEALLAAQKTRLTSYVNTYDLGKEE